MNIILVSFFLLIENILSKASCRNYDDCDTCVDHLCSWSGGRCNRDAYIEDHPDQKEKCNHSPLGLILGIVFFVLIVGIVVTVVAIRRRKRARNALLKAQAVAAVGESNQNIIMAQPQPVMPMQMGQPMAVQPMQIQPMQVPMNQPYPNNPGDNQGQNYPPMSGVYSYGNYNPQMNPMPPNLPPNSNNFNTNKGTNCGFQSEDFNLRQKPNNNLVLNKNQMIESDDLVENSKPKDLGYQSNFMESKAAPTPDIAAQEIPQEGPNEINNS
ncbi:MAG: hypothetical protein MJ252_15750 [archaeon]|nr:hypothetical protein [archaeon]